MTLKPAWPQPNTHPPSSRRATDLLFLQMTRKETTQDQKMLKLSLTTVSPKPHANNPCWGKYSQMQLSCAPNPIFALISWASQTKLTFQLSNPQDKTLKQILRPFIVTHFAEPLPQPFPLPLVSESRDLASLRLLSRKQFSFLQKTSGYIKAFNSHRAHIVVSAQQSKQRAFPRAEFSCSLRTHVEFCVVLFLKLNGISTASSNFKFSFTSPSGCPATRCHTAHTGQKKAI